MDDKNKLAIIITGATIIITSVLLIIFWPRDTSNNRNGFDPRSISGADAGNTSKKKVKMLAESYYLLDPLKFFAQPGEYTVTFVKLTVVLAYPFGEHEHEKEIIFKRDKINSLIQTYVSEKTYNQINTTDKRTKLKLELLEEINKNMKNKLTNIYFKKQFIIPSRKQ